MTPDRSTRIFPAARPLNALRLLVVLATALIGVLLGPVAVAQAEDSPQAPIRDSLTAENAGDVGVEQEGARATVTVDAERVYVFVYPDDGEPVEVGWQEPSDGSFEVDLSLMPAGAVTVALVDESGEPVGWATTELSAESSNAPQPEAAEEGRSANGTVPAWPWIVGAAAVLAASILFVAVRRRARHRRH